MNYSEENQKSDAVPSRGPDGYDARELMQNAQEAYGAAQSRLEFLSNRRNALEKEYAEAVARIESETETLRRLVRGLGQSLGHDEAKVGSPLSSTQGLLRNA